MIFDALRHEAKGGGGATKPTTLREKRQGTMLRIKYLQSGEKVE
jgi:hypothetical protein